MTHFWIAIFCQLFVLVMLIAQHKRATQVKQIVALLLYCCVFHAAAIVLNVGVPIGLLYGPLIRKAYLKRNGLEQFIDSRVSNIHLLPFYTLSVFYLLLCISGLAGMGHRISVLKDIYYSLYLWLLPLSLLYYSLSLLRHRIKENFELYELEDRLLDMLVLLCLAVSFPLFMFSIDRFGEYNWGFRLEFVIYGVLFFATLIMVYYLFVTRVLKQGFYGVMTQLLDRNALKLSDQLDERGRSIEAQKICECLQTDELYLQPNVSLELLAERVALPKHVCSKLLNEEIGKSFYQLIAEYRIEHAIRLMESDENKRYTIEWLAQASGFSSKTSFNRYFKVYKGCVPSQYAKSKSSKDQTLMQ